MAVESLSAPLRFVVTVDTEADDAWSRPAEISLRNIRELPRFQALCDRFGIVPTYLLTYECAHREEALAVLRPLVESGACEIGHHLHVWSCPPFQRQDGDDIDHDWILAHQFLLPDELFAAKAECLRAEIEANLGRSPTSHRAGRWGIDQRTVDWLAAVGFVVETSVRPGMRLPKSLGRHAGTTYGLARNPYIWRSCADSSAAVVEIPATVDLPAGLLRRLSRRWQAAEWPGDEFVWRMHGRFEPPRMFRPNPAYRLGELSAMMDAAIDQGITVINLMLHSSELAPDCSPFTQTRDDLERIWAQLGEVFEYTCSLGITSQSISDVGRLALQSPAPLARL